MYHRAYGVSRVMPLSLMAGFLIMCLIGGCRHGFDPRLSEADSLMEDHPDSAMMILDSYHLDANSTAGDSAYYGMLLTHARYKNFIDETDDSLISVSSDFFLNHDDKEKASRAFFLKGMIQMNAEKLGDAAVSFSRGLDIARENKYYMWEGQCARGLFMIFCELNNGSEQVRFAQSEYDAFLKGGYEDWANYAELNIYRAFCNNGQYKKALAGIQGLLCDAEELRDTMLMEEILPVMGTCLYSIGDYKGSLEKYNEAYDLNPSVITENHGHNIAVAASHINSDSLSEDIRSLIEIEAAREKIIPAFKDLANQGRYKEAYYGLDAYKNVQDSVLQIILQNDVSESLAQYEDLKAVIRHEQLKTERITWLMGILLLLIMLISAVLFYKKRLYQRRLEKEHLEVSLDSLRKDLDIQVKLMGEVESTNKRINEKNELMTLSLRDILYERYKKINELCDSYFQDRYVKSKKNKLDKEINILLKDFSDPNFLKEVGLYIDRCLDGLYSAFICDYPNLNDDKRRLFMFMTLGLSTRSICVIMDIEHSNLYNRKARLKKMVQESDSLRKEDYLKSMQ